MANEAGYIYNQPVTAPPMDPAVSGLVRILPPSGSSFAIERRKLWIEAMRCVFGLVFHDDDAPTR